MQAMDCVESRELADKCEFFAVLPQAVPQFPKVRRYVHGGPKSEATLSSARFFKRPITEAKTD